MEVTTLADSGPGSLREALRAEGPRIVVFRVAGSIELKDTLRVKNPYLTVAGQTAPGGGILLKATSSSVLRLHRGVHDVIIRYLRLRNGSGDTDGYGNDNITVNGGHNIIFDHLSLSWSSDENISLYRKPGTPPIEDLTLQRSIIAEGLDGHSNGMIVGGDTVYDGFEQPLEAWRGIKNISIHHNLFSNNSHRNPRLAAVGVRVINNVVYNWKARVGSTTHGAVVDLINNTYRAGPLSDLERIFLHESFAPQKFWRSFPDPSLYSAGNRVEPGHEDPDTDNWRLHKFNFFYTPLPARFRRHSPLPAAPVPVPIQPARQAYRSVLADVGANARLDCLGNWVTNADAVDVRLLAEVRDNAGPTRLPARPAEAGGYPRLQTAPPCADRDRDGMADAWERRHGLRPDDPADGRDDQDGDGYTNVEEYLNGTAPRG